jgi:tryptophan-rich sensory protein
MAVFHHVNDDARTSSRPNVPRWLVGVGFALATFAVAALGSVANQTSIDSWYATLERPWFAPPNAVFGPTWTVLYVTIAIAGYLLWDADGSRRRPALALWGVQLALNLAWSVVFFGLRSMEGGLVVIVALLASIIALMLVAGRLRPVVSWLLLPYAAWVSFATALNAGYLVLN